MSRENEHSAGDAHRSGHHAIEIASNEKGYVEVCIYCCINHSRGKTALITSDFSLSCFLQFIYPSPEHLARTLAWQFWALMLLVTAHVFVVGYTDPLDSSELSIQVIVIG